MDERGYMVNEVYNYECSCGASLTVPFHVRKMGMSIHAEAAAEYARDKRIDDWLKQHSECPYRKKQ